ncbi:uncharacterized protein METZ01_LOCUS102413, partial [marine metagenome]
VLKGLSTNINLFYTPTQINENLVEKGVVFRAGGMVKAGSIKRHQDSLLISFEVTDFKETLVVFYEGILPDLFSENAGVVVKGKLNDKGIFFAEEVLAKHDENYMPPEVAKMLKEE